MKAIYAVGAAGLLLAGGAAGYQLGTWSLTDIRGQLKAIEEKGAQADAARVAAQKEIDTKLAVRAAEYDRQVAELQAGFAKEKDAMALSLASAQQRLTALQGKSLAADSELARLRASKDSTAVESDRLALQAKIDALEAEKAKLAEEATGLSCLAAKVPSDEVKHLNNTQDRTLRAER